MRRYMFPIILFLTDTVTLCISVWLAVVLRFAGSGTNYQGYISNGMLLHLGLRSLLVAAGGTPMVLSRLLMLLICFFNIFFIAAIRLFVRWAAYQVEKADKENDTEFKRVLIVGAGDAGNIILRDLRQRDHRKVVGFIDDDPVKQKQIMNGVPVLGTRHDIEHIAYDKGVQEIIIAIPSMEIEDLNELAELCSNAGPNVTVPASTTRTCGPCRSKTC